jgi:hypothetical protein
MYWFRRGGKVKTFMIYTMDFILMFLVTSFLFISITSGEFVVSFIMFFVFVVVVNNYVLYRRIYLTGKC